MNLEQLHSNLINWYVENLSTFIPEKLIHWAFGIACLLIISALMYFILRGRKLVWSFIDWLLELIGNAKHFYHNYSLFINDLMWTIFAFYLAIQAYIKFENEKSIWAGIGVISLAILKALFRIRKVSKGIGKEFETIYDSKLKIGRSFNKYIDERNPIFNPNLFNHTAVDSLVREVLFNQLELIKTLFKPGFSVGGEDKYSVSILFYDHRSEEWDLYTTITLPGDKRSPSKWPIKKEDFEFDEDLYVKKVDRIYNIIELEKPEYESVLQIPLYFKKNYDKKNGLKKNKIYAIISFASRKKQSFQKLSSVTGPVRKFFLPEIYMLEKYLYKLYRFYVKI